MSSLFPLAFPIFFAGMWTGVSYLLSRLSGWRALAERYPAGVEPPGDRMIWTSAKLGHVSFRSCLNMTLSPSGLYMVPSLIFRLFMPALLIPWSDVRYEGMSKIFFLEFACLDIGGLDGTRLCLHRRDIERFFPFLSAQDRSDHAAGRRLEGSLFDKRILVVAAAAAVLGLLAALTARR